MGDLKFIITEAVKSYVRRINIIGNTRTLDKVIRREFSISEGELAAQIRLGED